MIHVFQDNEIVVRRLRSADTGESFQATATVWSDIQEMDEKEAEVMGLHPARSFVGYVDVHADIKKGDKLYWNESITRGSNEKSRMRVFNVESVDISKDWLASHKKIVLEEVFD